MPIDSVCLKVDNESVVPVLRDAAEKLGGAETELILDFTSVQRIQPGALGAMEQLAGAAAEKGAKVVLRGVNVDVYKVLKLTKLAARFSFDN
jgi:anti-anti-sigma regulatory factor